MSASISICRKKLITFSQRNSKRIHIGTLISLLVAFRFSYRPSLIFYTDKLCLTEYVYASDLFEIICYICQ